MCGRQTLVVEAETAKEKRVGPIEWFGLGGRKVAQDIVRTAYERSDRIAAIETSGQAASRRRQERSPR